MPFNNLGGYAQMLARMQGQNQMQIPGFMPPIQPMAAPPVAPEPMQQVPGAPVPQVDNQPGFLDKITGLVSNPAQAGDITDGQQDIRKWIIPMAMMQYGAAMQAPPEQRGAILAKLPGTIVSLMQQQELAKYRGKVLNERAARYDPLAKITLEETKQAGREKLQAMRDELQTKIQGMRDSQLDKRLSAQDERQLRMFEQQAAMLDARLGFQESQQNQRFNQQQSMQDQRLSTPRPRAEVDPEVKRDKYAKRFLSLSEKLDDAKTQDEKDRLINEIRAIPGVNEIPGKPQGPGLPILPTWAGGYQEATPPKFTMDRGGAGGSPKPSGFQGPGYYRVKGAKTAVRTQEEYDRLMGK